MTPLPGARRRRARRTALVLGLAVTATVALSTAQVPSPADAADSTVTTKSTRTIPWLQQNPRHLDDGADSTSPEAYDKLKDLKLRVSQTADLLNQTVEVSWEGLGTTGTESFLQFMQCWSNGPDVPPTREQCAFGGIDSSAADGTGLGRTRQLGLDPRERTYRDDGTLNPVAVNGALPGASWTSESLLVLGTNQQTCPAAAVGYAVTIVPPRAATASGSLPPSLVLEGPTSTRPGSLTRQENGSERTYSTVTSGFTLSDVAASRGLTTLPLGVYRFQLGCLTANGSENARFVGYLHHTEVSGARVWRRSSHAGGVSVPFDPLGDTPDTAPTDPYERDEVLEYLKPRSTNEIWQGLRRADGGGTVFMEMLTDLEAQHLGCGRVDADQVRSCWLVAVPRFGREPNGTGQVTAGLYSPLSQTLWDRRIEVPLAFAPVAAGCTIGSGLKQVLAHDSALNALRSWQPTFCGEPSTATSVLGPLQDFSIRGGIDKPNRMGVVGLPDQEGETIVRAPLVTSGVVIGFAVDRQIAFGRENFEQLNGTRAEVMNLSPRLVAKLLTQSYDSGAAPNGGKTTGVNSPFRSGDFKPTYAPARSFPAENPRNLYQDPEFLRLNPDFASWLKDSVGLTPLDMAEILVSPNDTDAYQTLWQWVAGDASARAFLNGAPDPDGMLVNPYYKGQISTATSSFPLLDPTCFDDIEDPKADSFPMLCQINNHPRVEDDTRAAQAAVRGDTRKVNVVPPIFTGAAGEVLSYRAEPRQQQGKLGMMVITTSAVAERYGLPTARLQNASGEFVSASASAMATARAQMLVRGDGVLVPRPERVRTGGYPLTTNSYALVDVAATTQSQNNAFAAILDYAAGLGQRTGTAIGQLPPGYAPLTPALAAQTRAAAKLLRNPSSLLTAPSANPPVTPGTNGAGTDGPDPAGVDSSGAPLVPAPPEVSAGGKSPQIAPAKPPRLATNAASTTGASSSLQWTLPVLLLVGLLAAFAGRVLSTLGRNSS